MNANMINNDENNRYKVAQKENMIQCIKQYPSWYKMKNIKRLFNESDSCNK